MRSVSGGLMTSGPTIPHSGFGGSSSGGPNNINLASLPVAASSGNALQIPTPPELIVDPRPIPGRPNGRRYLRGRILGKGGFAKCYEATDLDTREIWAVKIVAKASLTKQRAKVKLLSEIAIHKTLNHEKVVRYVNHFDDADFVYIVLELCPNQTLNDLLKKKRRFSEQEAQFYTYELVQGLIYLRRERVIHRDLKLGNLFLGADMELKIGDFGLAAKLDYDEEKKTTICGTPNYIAPEILDNHQKGHSFQVDVWSLGVVMFTMLVGKPPFEDVDVKSTYQRIRDNAYAFPDSLYISSTAKNLVQSILRHDPKSRPTVMEIAKHPWFSTISVSTPPSVPVSIQQMNRLMGGSNGGAPQTPRGSIAMAGTPDGANYARIDSPQPLAHSNSMKMLPTPSSYQRQPLKSQNFGLAVSSNQQTAQTAATYSSYTSSATNMVRRMSAGCGGNNENVYNRATQSPGLRPPIAPSLTAVQVGPPQRSSSTTYSSKKSTTGTTYSQAAPMLASPHISSNPAIQSSPQVANPDEMFAPRGYRNGLSGSTHLVTDRMSMIPASQLPEAWVVKWIDYSSKYGIGYLMSNGKIGVYFNDATKMVYSGDGSLGSGSLVDYLYRPKGARVDSVCSYNLDDEFISGDAKKKTTLIKNFKGYLQTDNEKEGCTRGVSGFSGFTPPQSSTNSLLHVKRWMRTKHALVFQLSNKVWQVIFQDKTEVILSAQTHLCHYVGPSSDGMTSAASPPVTVYPLGAIGEVADEYVAKRLAYSKQVVIHMLGGSSGATPNQ